MLLTNETIFSTIVSLKKWAKAFIAGENYSLLQWTSFLFENQATSFKFQELRTKGNNEMNAQNIITDKQSQSYHILPVMNKNFPKISLLAFGILGQMINIPELDYCTIDKLYNNNRLNSIAELTDAVEELIATHCF